MYKSEVTLSVFYNGQFYAALFEKSDERGYSVCQRLFATRPLDNEILRLALKLQREEQKSALRAKQSSDKSRAADEKYELRAIKRKQKHRGR
ncbi:MAG: DUF2992 family protein [Burkholderiales bacterium]